MKKINTHSAHFDIISEQPNQNQNQNHPNESAKNKNQNPNGIKEKLSKQNQEFINNISASGFKQFHV